MRAFTNLAAVVVVAALAHCAGAAVYQVGPARTHTNLQSVARLLTPGDVVEVDGDATYAGGVTFDNDGTAAEKITIRGVRVNGLRPVLSGISATSGSAVVRVRADHYLFEGIDVTAGGNLTALRGFYNVGDDTTLRDSVVHDCPQNGISGAAVSGSLTVQYVEVHHCGAGGYAHQIYVESDNLRHPTAVFRLEFCFIHDGNGGNNVKSRVGRNEIYYNWIEGSAYHELDLIGADPSDQSVGANAVREDSDVVGNVFYKLGSSSGTVARFGSDTTGSSNGRYRFVNNTVIADRGGTANYGIFKLVGPRQSVEVHNNVFYRGGGLFLMVRESDLPSGSPNGLSGANNWVPKGSYAVPAAWTGTIFGTNPAFVDVTNFVLMPKTNSALFNAGIFPTVSPTNYPFPSPLAAPRFLPPIRAPYTNNAVVLRPVNGAIDIGAFEQSSEPPVVIVRPSITTQPQSQQINPGGDATFYIEAGGTAPLSYQWRFNGATIDSATDSSFTQANAQANNIGKYSVIVSNDAGAVVSVSALLTFTVPPTITVQPVNRTTIAGTSASFSVKATGTAPLAYQWLINGAEISGATAMNYTRPNLHAADVGSYSVIVSNIAGTASSANAVLVVTPDTSKPAVVIRSPANNARLSNDVVVVSGIAADNVRVTDVVYKWNNLNAPFVSATGTKNWSATLNLFPGTNTIRVKSVDFSGNESSLASRNFFFVVPSLFTVQTNGAGSVAPDLDGKFLEIGRGYKLTALPATNWLFTHWSGGVSSSNAVLAFVMQSNLVLQANFITNPFVAAKGSYCGLFADTNGVAHQSAGFFSTTVTDKGKFTGKLFVDGNTLSVSGNFGVDGRATASVPRTKFGKPPLNLNLNLDVENQFGATDRLYGTVGSGTWSSALRADRAVWTVANPATSFSNRFTMIIPGGDDPAVAPTGSGYGLVTVDALGKAQLSGALGDGAAISQLATISKNGDWPVYVPLYYGPVVVTNGAVITTQNAFKGCLLGWVALTNTTLAGTLNWIKSPIATDAFYPAGFTNVSALVASRYAAPPANTRSLDIVNGVVMLADGNLPSPLTNHFVLSANNALTMTTANGALRLSLSPQTGQLSGTFTHPGNINQPTVIRGAILQNQNLAAGFFPGTNQSGSILLRRE